MQWFFAQTIADQQQAMSGFVKHGERKHSSQLVNTIRSEILVEVNDDFGIGMGTEIVAMAFEFLPKLAEVIDLSVKHHPNRAVFVEHWLVSASQVNNAEPTHSQARTVLNEQPFIVRTAMNQRLTHLVDNVAVNPAVISWADNSSNTAHILNPSKDSHHSTNERPIAHENSAATQRQDLSEPYTSACWMKSQSHDRHSHMRAAGVR